MEKFSVKKPFTVLVAVIIIIVFGVVSVTRMPAELLPEMDIPYLMVITSYPGASPERVESEVSQPMEKGLGTVTHVKNVYSTSAENFSMVQLEFENGTNMDSAMVKVSSEVDQIASTLPESCGTPNIMGISMDMLATMYIGIERKGDDIYALSDYVNDEIIPVIERQEGVASVSGIGLVDKSIQVELNSGKIDGVNDRILAMTNRELNSALKKLNAARTKLDGAQQELNKQEKTFGSTLSSGVFGGISGNVATMAADIQSRIKPLISTLEKMEKIVKSMEGAGSSGSRSSSRSNSGNSNTSGGSNSSAASDAGSTADNSTDSGSGDAGGSGEADGSGSAGGDTDPSGGSAEEGGDTAPADGGNDSGSGSGSDSGTSNPDSGNNINSAIRAALRDIESRLNTAISGLREVVNNLSNTTSYSDLMEQVTRAYSIISQIRTLMSELSSTGMSGSASDTINTINKQIQNLSDMLGQAPQLMDTLEKTFGTLTQAQLDAAVGFSTAASQLNNAQAELDNAMGQYESARDAALKNANLNALVDASTLSQLIYAQNFSMPAGYIDDKDDNSWLLKVGDEYEDTDDLKYSLLCRIDGVGTVLLADVADVTVIDNAEDSYASLNGEDAVVLSIYKGSSYGTNEVSGNVMKAIEDLMEADENLEIVTLMDQGEYINMIVGDILKSMLLGALLAILVLALFLKSVRPTLVVAISIPLSVLLALSLLYFTNLSLNIMTLSGLSLGIGMLVDNSIVVLENIFRLRGREYTAPHAAVQGTKQVSGAIIASTLTTICVFVPMVFSDGTVRQLLLPMAFSVTFCLTASLIVAMTVVPAASSTLMRTLEPKTNETFEKIQNKYAGTLRWCLSHKALTLGVAVALLAVSIIRIVTMGIVLFPDMEGEEVDVTIVTSEEDDRSTSYGKVDQVMDALLTIDGVEHAGIIDASSTAGMFTSMDTGSSNYGTYICYVKPDPKNYKGSMQDLCDEITEVTKDIDCEVTASAGSMGDMSAMMSSGLSLNIYGNDLDRLTEIGADVAEIVGEVKGFTDISDGSEDADATLHLVINKDKAMSKGITVAQIYAEIARRLTTSVSSTTITTDGEQYEVIIKDTTHELTRENLLDIELEAGAAGGAGSGAMNGAAGSASGMAGGASAMTGGTSAAGAASASSGDDDGVYKLGEFAQLEETTAVGSIRRENLTRYLTVSATTEDGYNTTLLSRKLKDKLDDYELPKGYSIEMGGETDQVNEMLSQMVKMILLALLLIYLIMVAQFQSLLSPFIILFTVPLAFTGGMLGLIVSGEQLSMLSLMGFLILMGTVVNNGIVFVDYANRLRTGGLERRDALVATGQTRMRPIIMTAMTTILAMGMLIFGSGMGSQMGRGMAIVVAGGLLYATLMTLYIVPVMYDILFRRPPLNIDVGDDIDDIPDDADDFLRRLEAASAEDMSAAATDTTEETWEPGPDTEQAGPQNPMPDSEPAEPVSHALTEDDSNSTEE
ncbi:MAG: efflux RND transporter permease subunit [Firmicutes bacterium]|nr:efflux RND transporter permease subunit [Bacillota bacterium]